MRSYINFIFIQRILMIFNDCSMLVQQNSVVLANLFQIYRCFFTGF